jgi:DDE superfamily endonuclease
MTGLFFQDYLHSFDAYVSRTDPNRRVLLLVDNAPSHTWEELHLRHVEVLALPPNTTSKYQPLDAGPIAAFKKHVRRLQVQWGLDQLDVGKSPYKIDQLRAMRWAIRAWNSLDASVFANCWRHTTLLDNILGITQSPDTTSAPEPPLSAANLHFVAEFNTEYNAFVEKANIHNTMSVQKFLNPDEEQVVHQMLSNEEILTVAGQEDGEDELQEEAEADIPSAYANLPLEDKVIALAQVRSFIEDDEKCLEPSYQETARVLRAVQKKIKRDIEAERQADLCKQRCLISLTNSRRRLGGSGYGGEGFVSRSRF